jgi:hypothetical protein
MYKSSSAISSIIFLHCVELRRASCCQGKKPPVVSRRRVRSGQRLVGLPKQCQVASTPHTRHAWLLVSTITALAPGSPFLRRADKGAFLWRLFGISVIVGPAGGNYNVLVSRLLNWCEGKNGKLSGLRSALPCTISHSLYSLGQLPESYAQNRLVARRHCL